MGLGTIDPGRLAECLTEARRQAADAREQLRQGRDPLALKRAAAALKSGSGGERGKTFSDAAAAYLAAHESSWWSPVHARQWRQVLDDYVLPKIGRLPVSEVGPADLERVLQPLWRTKAEVARKVCGKVGMILNLAIAKEWRLAGNPASLRIMRTVLGPLARKRVHHPSLPYKDCPHLMGKLEDRKDVPALAIRWLVLTCVRSSEGRYATWREIDRDKGLWCIPGVRMKGGLEHRVPLSTGALAVLDSIARVKGNDFVFIGNGGAAISDTACRNVLRELGVDKTTGTLHGFRASFRTWCAENGIVDDVAEACLAHTIPDQVIRAYKRTTFDKTRADVMQKWADYLHFG